jgi:uncharacterized membrane protein YedE/YeeE
MIHLALTFLAGMTFAVGLGIAGMTQPGKVVGFLDVAGSWDPSLAFVMAGAVSVYGGLYRLILRRGRPLLSPTFATTTRSDIDARLVAGAALFGVGWGLAGYCPGPSIVSLAIGELPVLVFVAAMLVGMRLADLPRSRVGRVATTGPKLAFAAEERTT